MVSRKSLAFPPEGMLLSTMTLCYVFGVLLAMTVTVVHEATDACCTFTHKERLMGLIQCIAPNFSASPHALSMQFLPQEDARFL